MGRDPKASLAYGYLLGGGEDEWLIDGWGHEMPWPDPDGDGFVELVERRLLAAAGFTETRADDLDGHYARRSQAEKALTVSAERAGTWEYCQYYLYAEASLIHVEWGAKVVRPIIPDGADTHLAQALDTLGIRPTQAEPSWILASFYG